MKRISAWRRRFLQDLPSLPPTSDMKADPFRGAGGGRSKVSREREGAHVSQISHLIGCSAGPCVRGGVVVIMMIVSSLMPWRKVEAAVQPGWAKLLQNVKVRDGKSREAKVVGFLEEGRLVRVSKVCSKSAQLEEPLVGWVTLSKGGPVLHQVPAPQQQESSTAWAVASVMARFGATPGPAPAPTLPSFENCSSADRGAEVATVAAQAIEAPAPETTEETFHLLPSVGTWLSVPSAIYTEGDLQNGHASRPGAEEPKAEVPFRHLPSVATWLVPIKQGEQAENEMLCPSVPSVDARLQRRPPSSTSSRRATSRTDTSPSLWETFRRALHEMCCVGR